MEVATQQYVARMSSSLTGKEISLQNQLCAAVDGGKAGVVRKLLMDDGADPTLRGGGDPKRVPVYLATLGGHVAMVKLMLECNADPNHANHGETLVYTAAMKGHVAVVKLLLSHNADLNQARTDTQSHGVTPVFIAGLQGHTECVRVLLENGADPNLASTQDGVTPVFMTSQQGHTDCLRLLLEFNADVNKVKTHGVTPVYMAAQKGNAACMKVLLEYSPNVNLASTNEGATPLFIGAGQSKSIYDFHRESAREH